MLFQRTVSKMFGEAKPAEEAYSHLRVVRSQEELQKVAVVSEPVVEEPVVLSDAEIARNWIMNTLKVHEATFKSQKCLFGTIGFDVPVKECNPEEIKKIMAANHIELLSETPNRVSRTNELKSVYLLYDTPVEGIVYLF